MDGVAGGGGDVPSPRTPGVGRRREHHQQQQSKAPFLPLDMVLQIAARSDPATLVRCAATCRDARRRVVAGEESFRRRLRLRHAADGRFVPSLLRGHLVVFHTTDRRTSRITGLEVHLADVNVTRGRGPPAPAPAPGTAATSRRLSAADGFPPHPDAGGNGKSIMWHKPLAWRDGLFLVRTTDDARRRDELRVCDPATGRSQTLPPAPAFPGDARKGWQHPLQWDAMVAEKRWQPYVLLGGDGRGEVGIGRDAGGGGGGGGGFLRPFEVLKANLVLSEHHRYLETQTFSSESGTWGVYTKLRAPHFHGRTLVQRDGGRPLVVGGAVHWLCLTDAASYVLRLNLSTTKVTVTALPTSFPRPPSNKEAWYRQMHYLLATATAGGGLIVLVADNEKITAWVQTAAAGKWKQRPEVVVEYEAFLRFRNIRCSETYSIQLHWFGERSGLVLVYAGVGYGFFWLDLRSKKIVGCFSDPRFNTSFQNVFAPYEMDLSSWVPTFTSPI